MIDRVELFSDLIEFSGKSIHRTDHGVDAFECAVISEPFFFVSVENASDAFFQIFLYEHPLQDIGDNIIDLFAPAPHIAAVRQRMDADVRPDALRQRGI